MKSCIKRQSYGFTLIEAIVAMAILGAAMLPIMALLSQSINQIHKIAESNAQSAAKNSALSVLDPINPMETPNGEIDMGDFNLVWSSELIVPPNKEIKIGTGLAGYKVSFYLVKVELFKENKPWFYFTARKLGHERFENNNSPFQDSIR
jgi:general secretion pathway protein I